MAYQSGDLAAFEGEYLFSRLVMLVTRSRTTHLGLIYVKDGEPWVIHSDEQIGGCQMQKLSDLRRDYRGKIRILRHRKLCGHCLTIARVVKTAKGMIGLKYNKPLVAARAIQHLLSSIGLGWLMDRLVAIAAQRPEVPCSEVVSRAYAAARVAQMGVAPAPSAVVALGDWMEIA